MDRGIAMGVACGVLDGFAAGESPDPVYATWTDFANCEAESNGLRDLTAGTGWTAVARSVETMSGGGGLKFVVPEVSADFYVDLQIADSTADTNPWPASTYQQIVGPHTLYCRRDFDTGSLNRVEAYFGSTSLGGHHSPIVTGDVLEIRENGGAIEILVNEVVEYTFAQAPPDSMCARVAIYSPGILVAPLELTGGVWS